MNRMSDDCKLLFSMAAAVVGFVVASRYSARSSYYKGQADVINAVIKASNNSTKKS